ncbi:MAG: T9SS type A sorting domain-containing protein [Duncaniella sp.]|nr:T9SS type A sorting domain-containing protein [Duncaniella sp.]
MRKSLLLSLVAMTGLAASAVTPTMYDDSYAAGLSPNGQWGASYIYGQLKVIDLSTGTEIVISDGDDYGEYLHGNGNNMSNNGVLVGSASDIAHYLYNGEFVPLNDQILDLGLSSCNGITPDGSRIVGYYTNPENGNKDLEQIMYVPCYWDVNADGTVGETHPLPYPTTDFTGRPPQYIFATCVSNDGKVIAGQIVDYAGRVAYPIVYTCNSEGTWEYSLPADKYMNPNHIELPSLPAEPVYPQIENFMTPEEKAAYDAAMEIYYNSGYQDDLFPNIEDYITPEEFAAYQAAMAEYEELSNAWYEAFIAFSEIFEQVLEESVPFMMNSIAISPDGHLIAVGCEIPGADFFDPRTYYTSVIDLSTGDLKEYGKTEGCTPIRITNNCAVVSSRPLSFGGDPVQTYIKLPDAETMQPIETYFASTNPEIATWMNEKLLHQYFTYDFTTDEMIEHETLFSGFMLFDQDLKTFFAGVMPTWEGYEEEFPEYFSYTASGLTSGLKNVTLAAKEDVKVSAQRGGVLTITGNADVVTVYDLSGREVFSAKAASTLNTGLPSGFYLVKTEGAEGAKTTKVTF